MEKRKKISVTRLLSKMCCISDDHSLWELNIIKLLEEKQYRLFIEKGDDNIDRIFFSNKDMSQYTKNEVTEVDFSEASLKKRLQYIGGLSNTQDLVSIINLNSVIEDEEIRNLYLSNPDFLEEMSLEKITMEEIEQSDKLLNGVSYKKEERRPLFFKSPKQEDLIFLLLDKYKKNDFKNIRELSDEKIKIILNTVYMKNCFYSKDDIGQLVLKNNLNLFMDKINEEIVEDFRRNSYEFTSRVLDIYARIEEDYTYPISEYVNIFDNICNSFAELNLDKKKEFKEALNSTTKALKLFEIQEKIDNRVLFNDEDLEITKETIIRISMDRINQRIFKEIEDFSSMGSDIFSVKIDTDREPIFEIRYSLNLNNLSEKEIVHRVLDMLVNPKNAPADIENYFKELNLRVLLDDKKEEHSRTKAKL